MSDKSVIIIGNSMRAETIVQARQVEQCSLQMGAGVGGNQGIMRGQKLENILLPGVGKAGCLQQIWTRGAALAEGPGWAWWTGWNPEQSLLWAVRVYRFFGPLSIGSAGKDQNTQRLPPRLLLTGYHG